MNPFIKRLLAVYIFVSCAPVLAMDSCEKLVASIPQLSYSESSSPFSPSTAGKVIQFLNSRTPKYSTDVEFAMKSLESVDTSNPEVQAKLTTFTRALMNEAHVLFRTPPLKDASAEDLQSQSNKFRLLNVPSLRNLLPPEFQSKIGQSAWAYNRTLWNNTLSVSQKIAALQSRLAAIQSQKPLTVLPASKISPNTIVNVIHGDILKVEADATIASIGCDGYCSSALNNQLRSYLGKAIDGRQLKDGEVLTINTNASAKGPSKRFVLIVDDQNLPLHQIVFKALVEAEKSGASSAAIPDLRTGDGFGSIEKSYDQVVSELVKGVSLFSAQGNGNLKRIDFVVYNEIAVYQKIANELHQAKQPRERSIRNDMREAKLSGEGFTLIPSKVRAKVDVTRSPIYKTMLQPWDLSHMMEAHPPLRIGTLANQKAFSAPVVSVLNMPIKMPGSGFKIPKELAQFTELIQKMIDHEVEINPELDKFFAYITVDQNFVTKGKTHRRGGIHIDGVQGARYPVKLRPEHTYSASDAFGTVFYNQSYDLRKLDPNKQHVHAEIERQSRPENSVVAEDYGIFFWDSYSAHEANVATSDRTRTFVRIEFSEKIYDGVGDTVNPLFDYNWPRVDRAIPANLDDRPVAPIVPVSH